MLSTNGESSSASFLYWSRMKVISFCFEQFFLPKSKQFSFSSWTSKATWRWRLPNCGFDELDFWWILVIENHSQPSRKFVFLFEKWFQNLAWKWVFVYLSNKVDDGRIFSAPKFWQVHFYFFFSECIFKFSPWLPPRLKLLLLLLLLLLHDHTLD